MGGELEPSSVAVMRLSRSTLLFWLCACPSRGRAAGLQPGIPAEWRNGMFLPGMHVNRAGKPNAICAAFCLVCRYLK